MFRQQYKSDLTYLRQFCDGRYQKLFEDQQANCPEYRAVHIFSVMLINNRSQGFFTFTHGLGGKEGTGLGRSRGNKMHHHERIST